MTPTPFARVNAATMRADRNAQLRRWVTAFATLALVALAATATGHLILTATLNASTIAAQAEALKGM